LFGTQKIGISTFFVFANLTQKSYFDVAKKLGVLFGLFWIKD